MLHALHPPDWPNVGRLPDSPWNTPVPGFGVDTVRLRGPASDELLRQLPEKRYSQMVDDQTGALHEAQRSGYTAVVAGHSLARVRADLRSGRPEVAIEFSAPSIERGHNLEPLPVAMVVGVVGKVWEAVAREVSGMASFDKFWVNRLDLDRDFIGVLSIPFTLQAISQRPVSRARTDRLERGNNGLWQSLTRGNSKRWLAVGYGKGQQLAELAEQVQEWDRRERLRLLALAAPDRLRWELQLRRERLREFGLLRPDDLQQGIIYDMSRQHFDRSRFGDLIAGGTQRLHESVTALTPVEQRGVLAVLGADLIGLTLPMSHNSEARYRRLIRELQLAPNDFLGRGDEELRRLDFELGVEVRGRGALQHRSAASKSA